jgi:hypothetical protein
VGRSRHTPVARSRKPLQLGQPCVGRGTAAAALRWWGQALAHLRWHRLAFDECPDRANVGVDDGTAAA